MPTPITQLSWIQKMLHQKFILLTRTRMVEMMEEARMVGLREEARKAMILYSQKMLLQKINLSKRN